MDPGSVLVLPTRKTQALLAYLALPLGQSHPRDKLAALLWGDMPDAQALGNLRQALARVRRVLPRPVLRALVLNGKSVALDPSLVEVDAARFDTLDPGVRAEMVRLVPALGDRSVGAVPSEPSQVFGAVAQMLGALATRRPLLLVLEGLQWADEMTLRLVAFLTRALPPRPVLLAVSARAEGLADTPMLSRTLDELLLHRRLLRLDLDALSERATLDLAGRVASAGRIRQALATLGPEVWRVSEGNPFVVVETMQALERGAVPEATPLGLPGRVRTLVAGRLERLPEPERRLVTVAAVIGRRFSFRLLHHAVGLDEEEVAATLERLVRHRVLHGVGEAFDFMHDRIRTVAYDLLLPPRRALLHRRVAGALEVIAEHDAPSQHLVLGTHYRLGEVWDQALTHLVAAGRMGAARGAHQESVTCYDRALEVLERLPTSDELRARTTDLLIDLGDALHNDLGEFQRASAAYRRAEPLATAFGDEARLVRIWSGQAYTDVSTGKHRAALSAGERALEGAERLGDLDLEIWTRASLVRTHDALGNYERAADICRATIPMLQQRPRGHLFGPTLVLLHGYVRGWLAIPLAFLGEFDEAMQVALEAVEIAEQEGRDQDRAWAYSCLGRVHQELSSGAGRAPREGREARRCAGRGGHGGSAVCSDGDDELERTSQRAGGPARIVTSSRAHVHGVRAGRAHAISATRWRSRSSRSERVRLRGLQPTTSPARSVPP